MNTLEKKLTSKGENIEKESQEVVKEAKLLLADNAAEERRLLKSIGLDNELQIMENKNEDLLIRKGGYDKYGCKIIHAAEIRELCEDYRLFIKPASKFAGALPPELAADLVRFCKERSVPLPANTSYSDFFIIAPPKMFKDYQSPGKVLSRAWVDADRDVEEERRLRRLAEDPILVMRLRKSSVFSDDHFAIIKSWGEDFTPLRRVYGELTKKRSLEVIRQVLNWSMAYLFILYLPKSLYAWMNTLEGAEKGQGTIVFLTFLFFMATLITYMAAWWTNEKMMRFRDYIVRTVTKKYI